MIMARALFTAGLAVAGTTQAAVWNGQGQGSVSAGYDDNVRLATTTTSTVRYVSAVAAGHLALQNESLVWAFDPHLSSTRYDHLDEFNRSETSLASSLEQQGEKGTNSLVVNWVQDTTLTSELGHTEFTTINKRHQATSLTAANTQQWSERFSTQSSLYAATNHYMDADRTGLVNYEYGSALASIGYALSLQSQISLDGSIGKLRVPHFAQDTKTNQSVMLSYTLVFAERWNTKLSFGPSQVRSELSTESGTVYEFSINRKSELSSLQLKLARDITPSGQGVLTRREQFSLSASRALSERWNSGVNVSVIRNDSLLLSNSFNFYGVRYSDTSVNLSWRWTPQISLSLYGGHIEQRVQGADRTAARNYATLNLGWYGLGHTWH